MFYCLLTVTGPDLPELLHKFCETLVLMEGVILESQQSVLAGQSVALYKVFLPAQHLSFAQSRFSEFERQGLNITMQELPPNHPGRGEYLELTLSGQYRFYLCHDLRMILDSHGARVEQMNLHYKGQELTSGQDFTADQPCSIKVVAAISRPISESNLIQALQQLAPELEIQLELLKARELVA